LTPGRRFSSEPWPQDPWAGQARRQAEQQGADSEADDGGRALQVAAVPGTDSAKPRFGLDFHMQIFYLPQVLDNKKTTYMNLSECCGQKYWILMQFKEMNVHD
jgi:hypothetical protein